MLKYKKTYSKLEKQPLFTEEDRELSKKTPLLGRLLGGHKVRKIDTQSQSMPSLPPLPEVPATSLPKEVDWSHLKQCAQECRQGEEETLRPFLDEAIKARQRQPLRCFVEDLAHFPPDKLDKILTIMKEQIDRDGANKKFINGITLDAWCQQRILQLHQEETQLHRRPSASNPFLYEGEKLEDLNPTAVLPKRYQNTFAGGKTL